MNTADVDVNAIAETISKHWFITTCVLSTMIFTNSGFRAAVLILLFLILFK